MPRLVLLILLGLLLVPQAAAGAQKPPLGFVSDWDASKELELSSQIGARSNHLAVYWSAVESRPPCLSVTGGLVHSYDWSATDRQLSGLSSAPVMMAFAAPAWAQDPNWEPTLCGLPTKPITPNPPCSCAYPPAPNHVKDWGSFVEALTERYGNSIEALEVWNEPNFSRFWSPAPDPAAYSQLLRASKVAAAGVDPGLPVIIGGLLPSQKHVPGEQIKHDSFLKRLYQLGSAQWFDGVGTHPYPFGAPWVKGMQKRLNQLRRVQKRFGDRAPMWITEIGLPAQNGSKRWVSLKQQGPTLWKMYRSTWGQRVRSFTIYSLYAVPGEGSFSKYGVTKRNFQPKPAWCHLYQRLKGKTYPTRLCRKQK